MILICTAGVAVKRTQILTLISHLVFKTTKTVFISGIYYTERERALCDPLFLNMAGTTLLWECVTEKSNAIVVVAKLCFKFSQASFKKYILCNFTV